MKLILSKYKYRYEDDFFYWLLAYLKKYLQLKVDYRKLYNFQKALDENKKALKLTTSINGKNVFDIGVKNLDLLNYKNEVVIQINQSEIYPGTQININTLCKMINYGTLDFQPYPIFTKCFDYIEKNISTLYLMYKRRLNNVK